MLRLAPIALVVALLAATAAAFAVTEGLKLTPSPIRSTRVDKVFSPTCRCATAAAHVQFRLRKADRLTLVLVDSRNRVVRTLVDARSVDRGVHRFAWNGRDDAGARVPDGVYRPRVHLARQHRTILLPNPIRVDTRPPTAAITIRRRLLTPGLNRVSTVYRLSEPAHPQLLADGRVVVRGRFERTRGKLDWYGAGFPAGVVRLSLRAVDLAGNVGEATPAVPVRIVYLELARHRLRVKARGALAVGFGPLRSARWRLAGRTGVARGGHVRIKAPARPGAYTLFLFVDGHGDRARVVVAP